MKNLSILNLPVTIKNNVQVMSSLDLAKLCVGESKDAHSNFMKKAEKVLGEDLVNFYDISKDTYGRNRTMLLLPEREACLMAMSYSYELQAYVFDEWQKLKKQTPNKLDTIDSLQQDVELKERSLKDRMKACTDLKHAIERFKALESQEESTPLLANVKTQQQIEDEFMLSVINSSKATDIFNIECNAIRRKNNPFQAYKRRGMAREMLRKSVSRLIDSGAISAKQVGIQSH